MDNIGIKKYLKYSSQKLLDSDAIREIFQSDDIYEDHSTFFEISEKITNIIINRKNFEQLIKIALKYDLEWLLLNCLRYLNDQYDIRIECDEFRILSIDVFFPDPNIQVVSNLIDYLFSIFKEIFNLSQNVHKINLLIHWEDNRIFYRDFIEKYKANIQSIIYLSSVDIPPYFKHFIYQNCKNLSRLEFISGLSLFDDFDFKKYSLDKLKTLKLKWIDDDSIRIINFSKLPSSIESLELEFFCAITSLNISGLENLKFIKMFSLYELENITFDNVPKLNYVEISNCPKIKDVSGINKKILRLINCC